MYRTNYVTNPSAVLLSWAGAAGLSCTRETEPPVSLPAGFIACNKLVHSDPWATTSALVGPIAATPGDVFTLSSYIHCSDIAAADTFNLDIWTRLGDVAKRNWGTVCIPVTETNGSFVRLSQTFTIAADEDQFSLFIGGTVGTSTVYITGTMIEKSAAARSYFDGDSPGYCYWTGARSASTSIKEPPLSVFVASGMAEAIQPDIATGPESYGVGRDMGGAVLQFDGLVHIDENFVGGFSEAGWGALGAKTVYARNSAPGYYGPVVVTTPYGYGTGDEASVEAAWSDPAAIFGTMRVGDIIVPLDEEGENTAYRKLSGPCTFETGPSQVSLVFDDSPYQDYSVVFPALQARGLKGTFGSVWARVVVGEAGGFVSVSQLRTMQDAGHEVLCHTRNETTTPASWAEFVDETVTVADDMRAAGFDVHGWDVPGGWDTASDYAVSTAAAYNTPADLLLRANFDYYWSYIKSCPLARPRLPDDRWGAGHHSPDTLAGMKTWIDNAALRPQGEILCFHSFLLGTEGHLSVAAFEEGLDYLKAAVDDGTVEVVPLKDQLYPSSGADLTALVSSLDAVRIGVNAVQLKTDNLPAVPASKADADAAAASTANADAKLDAVLLKTNTIGGAGGIAWPYTLTVNGMPCADAAVWVTTDEAGNNVVASGRTDDFGALVPVPKLDAGTYYFWAKKSGVNFEVDIEVVA